MAPSRTPSQSYLLQQRTPALASVTRATATRSVRIDSRAESTTSTTKKAADSIRQSSKSVGGATRTPTTTATTRKRTRRDSLDENKDNGDTERAPRVRQRLTSTSSMETIRPHTYSGKEPGAAPSAARASLSRQSSRASLRGAASTDPRPLAEANLATAADVTQTPATRTLRRVGTAILKNPSTILGDTDNVAVERDSAKYRSRIPRPASQSSMAVATETDRVSRPRTFLPSSSSSKDRSTTISARRIAREESLSSHPSQRVSHPPTSCATGAPSGAPIALLDRYDLAVAPSKKHTELWDQNDSAIYAWSGSLTLTDKDLASNKGPVVQSVEIQCSTHSYEGRFATETNALPVFSTRFNGCCATREAFYEDVSLSTFNPDTGIVMDKEWVSSGRMPAAQWYGGFWVPIPMELFRNKDTRMFRMKAKFILVDERSGKTVTVSSGMVLGGISHLRKQRDMDSAVIQL